MLYRSNQQLLVYRLAFDLHHLNESENQYDKDIDEGYSIQNLDEVFFLF